MGIVIQNIIMCKLTAKPYITPAERRLYLSLNNGSWVSSRVIILAKKQPVQIVDIV